MAVRQTGGGATNWWRCDKLVAVRQTGGVGVSSSMHAAACKAGELEEDAGQPGVGGGMGPYIHRSKQAVRADGSPLL